MDDYDTCFERALDQPAFSNSDDGLGWMDAHCGRCFHDKPARRGDEANGCPLILVALMGHTPVEWMRGEPSEQKSFADKYTCVMFRPEDDGGDPEPKPIPTPPGQGELFPRDGFEGVRMLRPYAIEKQPEAVPHAAAV